MNRSREDYHLFNAARPKIIALMTTLLHGPKGSTVFPADGSRDESNGSTAIAQDRSVHSNLLGSIMGKWKG